MSRFVAACLLLVSSASVVRCGAAAACEKPQEGPFQPSLLQSGVRRQKKSTFNSSVTRNTGPTDIFAASCATIGCANEMNTNHPCQCDRSCTKYGFCCHDFYNVCVEKLQCSTTGTEGGISGEDTVTGEYNKTEKKRTAVLPIKRCVLPFQFEGAIYHGCTGSSYADGYSVLSDVLQVSNDSAFWKGTFSNLDPGGRYEFWNKRLTLKSQWCGTSCGAKKTLLNTSSIGFEVDCKEQCDNDPKCNCYEFMNAFEDNHSQCDLFDSPPLGSPGREIDSWGQCTTEIPCLARNQNTGGTCGTRRRRCSLFSVPPCSNNTCSAMRGDVSCDEDSGYCMCNNESEVVTHYHFPIPNFGVCKPALPIPAAQALNPGLLEKSILYIGNSFLGWLADPLYYTAPMWQHLVDEGKAGSARAQEWKYFGGSNLGQHKNYIETPGSYHDTKLGATAGRNDVTWGFFYLGDKSSRADEWTGDSPAATTGGNYKNSLDALPVIDNFVAARGARFILHMTWAYKRGRYCEMQERVIKGYDYYAQHVDTTNAGRKTMVSPVGVAWRFMHHQNNALWSKSYYSDNGHCNKAGFYIMAAVVYGVLTNEDPETLPLPSAADVSAEDAREYQKFASLAVKACGNWGPDENMNPRRECWPAVQAIPC